MEINKNFAKLLKKFGALENFIEDFEAFYPFLEVRERQLSIINNKPTLPDFLNYAFIWTNTIHDSHYWSSIYDKAVYYDKYGNISNKDIVFNEEHESILKMLGIRKAFIKNMKEYCAMEKISIAATVSKINNARWYDAIYCAFCHYNTPEGEGYWTMIACINSNVCKIPLQITQ